MECYLVKKSLFKITRERKNHHTLYLHGCKAEAHHNAHTQDRKISLPFIGSLNF